MVMSLFSRWGVGALLVVVVILGEILPSLANVLVNPGFETGDFTGWTVGGTNGGSGVAANGTVIPGTQPPFGTTTVLAHSGNFAAFGVIAATAGESLTLSQTLNLVPGNYDIGYFMGNDSSSEFGIGPPSLFGIIANGTHLNITFDPPLAFGTNVPITKTAGEMEEVISNFSSPGGLTTLEFDISGSGTARAGISVDDFFVNPAAVPEPNTLALFGVALGGLGLLRRRRYRPHAR
jgi:hypothetical protein